MYKNISEIKQANRDEGYHFFDVATLRFFNGKVLPQVYGGRYFVTSEQVPDNPRRYTVRRAEDNGTITTVGEFCQYGTAGAAKFAAKKAAQGDK